MKYLTRQNILIFLAIFALLGATVFTHSDTFQQTISAATFGGGSGTINQLSPFVVGSGQVRLASSTADFRIPSLVSEDCVGTDSNGVLGAGTCTGGAGGSGLWDYGVQGTDVLAPIVASTSNTARVTASSFHATSTATSSTFSTIDLTQLTISGDDITDFNGNGLVVSSGILSADIATATALTANGSNCSAGNFPLGVDASGVVETCTDAWTEAENTSAAYISNITGESIFDLSDVSGSSAASGTLLVSDGTNFNARATSTLGLFGDLTDFTGTLTDTKICTYDAAGGEIDCNYTDLSGGSGDSVWSRSNGLIYTPTTTDSVAVGTTTTTTANARLEVAGLLKIVQELAATHGLLIEMNQTGHGILVDQNTNGKGIYIDSEATGANALHVDTQVTGTNGVYINGQGVRTAGNSLMWLDDNAVGNAGPTLTIDNVGTSNALTVTGTSTLATTTIARLLGVASIDSTTESAFEGALDLESLQGALIAGQYGAATIDGDDINSNIAGRSLSLTSASPDTLDADAELYTDSRTFNFASSTLGTSTQPVLSWLAPQALTISTITCTEVNGSAATSTIQFEERTNINSAGTDVLGGGGIIAGSGAETASSTMPNSGIASGNWLVMLIDGFLQGTPRNPVCDVKYTYDD